MLIAVLTVSDRCSRGHAIDTAGPAVVAILHEEWPDAQIDADLLPDEPAEISSYLGRQSDRGASLVLTVGGTGLGPRDRTPEATLAVVDREVPGLAEMMRSKGAEINSLAWLSRGLAGLRGRTLILNLPGSLNGAQESLTAVLPVLRHAIDVASGGQHQL
jgi:molybdopterin adenylyltransferase